MKLAIVSSLIFACQAQLIVFPMYELIAMQLDSSSIDVMNVLYMMEQVILNLIEDFTEPTLPLPDAAKHNVPT